MLDLISRALAELRDEAVARRIEGDDWECPCRDCDPRETDVPF